MAQVLEYLVEILTAALAAAMITGISFGVKWLLSKTKGIENDTARKMLESALENAERVGHKAVMAVNQQFVDDLREAAEDGKITKDEAKKAMGKAKDKFLNVIDDKSLKILENSLGSVDDWLEDFLEAQLGQLKSQGLLKGSKEFNKNYDKIQEMVHPKE